jgi:hypothetical protein
MVKDSSWLRSSRSKWQTSRSDKGECCDERNGDGSVRLVVGSWIARATCSARFRFALGRSPSLQLLPGISVEKTPRGGLHYVDRDSGLPTGAANYQFVRWVLYSPEVR